MCRCSDFVLSDLLHAILNPRFEARGVGGGGAVRELPDGAEAGPENGLRLDVCRTTTGERRVAELEELCVARF